MPIHINDLTDGNFVTVHVSGILSQADYERFVPKFEQSVQQDSSRFIVGKDRACRRRIGYEFGSCESCESPVRWI